MTLYSIVLYLHVLAALGLFATDTELRIDIRRCAQKIPCCNPEEIGPRRIMKPAIRSRGGHSTTE